MHDRVTMSTRLPYPKPLQGHSCHPSRDTRSRCCMFEQISSFDEIGPLVVKRGSSIKCYIPASGLGIPHLWVLPQFLARRGDGHDLLELLDAPAVFP